MDNSVKASVWLIMSFFVIGVLVYIYNIWPNIVSGDNWLVDGFFLVLVLICFGMGLRYNILSDREQAETLSES